MRIVFDGNIGSGKTCYLKKLEQDGFLVNHEDIMKWSDWLKKYNNNMNRFALGFQLQILYDQLHLPYHTNKINIYERSPYTLQNVFGELLFEDNIFDKTEYQLHNLYVEKFGWVPDAIIYLYCDPEICYQRTKKRLSVSGDEDLEQNYFDKLHARHEIVFDELNCQIPIYKINSQEDSDVVYGNILDILGKLNDKISK